MHRGKGRYEHLFVYDDDLNDAKSMSQDKFKMMEFV